jgi:hypothetical protein
MDLRRRSPSSRNLSKPGEFRKRVLERPNRPCEEECLARPGSIAQSHHSPELETVVRLSDTACESMSKSREMRCDLLLESDARIWPDEDILEGRTVLRNIVSVTTQMKEKEAKMLVMCNLVDWFEFSTHIVADRFEWRFRP